MYFRFIISNIITFITVIAVQLGVLFFISAIFWLFFRNVRRKIVAQLLGAYITSICLIVANLNEPYVLGYIISLIIFTTIKIIQYKKSFKGETYKLIATGVIKESNRNNDKKINEIDNQ